MEWNGRMEGWNGMDREMEWKNGMEWNGMDWNGMDHDDEFGLLGSANCSQPMACPGGLAFLRFGQQQVRLFQLPGARRVGLLSALPVASALLSSGWFVVYRGLVARWLVAGRSVCPGSSSTFDGGFLPHVLLEFIPDQAQVSQLSVGGLAGHFNWLADSAGAAGQAARQDSRTSGAAAGGRCQLLLQYLQRLYARSVASKPTMVRLA